MTIFSFLALTSTRSETLCVTSNDSNAREKRCLLIIVIYVLVRISPPSYVRQQLVALLINAGIVRYSFRSYSGDIFSSDHGHKLSATTTTIHCVIVRVATFRGRKRAMEWEFD